MQTHTFTISSSAHPRSALTHACGHAPGLRLSGEKPALAVTHVITPHLCSRWLALKDTRRDSRARRRRPPAALIVFRPETPEQPALPASQAETSPALRGCAVQGRLPSRKRSSEWFRRLEPLSTSGGRHSVPPSCSVFSRQLEIPWGSELVRARGLDF